MKKMSEEEASEEEASEEEAMERLKILSQKLSELNEQMVVYLKKQPLGEGDEAKVASLALQMEKITAEMQNISFFFQP